MQQCQLRINGNLQFVSRSSAAVTTCRITLLPRNPATPPSPQLANKQILMQEFGFSFPKQTGSWETGGCVEWSRHCQKEAISSASIKSNLQYKFKHFQFNAFLWLLPVKRCQLLWIFQKFQTICTRPARSWEYPFLCAPPNCSVSIKCCLRLAYLCPTPPTPFPPYPARCCSIYVARKLQFSGRQETGVEVGSWESESGVGSRESGKS